MGKGRFGPMSSPRYQGPADARVYVGNLAWETTWQELKDHMREAGDVVHVDILSEADGRSKGCGLVAYRTAEDALNAVQELNDSELMGRQIFVREDRETDDGGKGGDQACRVYVGNLAWSVTWKDLKDHFKSAGDVVRADVMCEGNVEGGRSKGYGVVAFRSPEQATAAVEQLEDTELQGRKITVREDRDAFRRIPQPGPASGWGGGYTKGGKRDYYRPAGDGGKGGKGEGDVDPSLRCFVGNISWSTSWQKLKDYMRQVGDVVHVEIMTEDGTQTGRSRGFGYVEFATYGAARRAIERLHDTYLGDRMLLVREYCDTAPGYGSGKAKGKGKGKKGRQWTREG